MEESKKEHEIAKQELEAVRKELHLEQMNKLEENDIYKLRDKLMEFGEHTLGTIQKDIPKNRPELEKKLFQINTIDMFSFIDGQVTKTEKRRIIPQEIPLPPPQLGFPGTQINLVPEPSSQNNAQIAQKRLENTGNLLADITHVLSPSEEWKTMSELSPVQQTAPLAPSNTVSSEKQQSGDINPYSKELEDLQKRLEYIDLLISKQGGEVVHFPEYMEEALKDRDKTVSGLKAIQTEIETLTALYKGNSQKDPKIKQEIDKLTKSIGDAMMKYPLYAPPEP
ncbi:MAG: hypothetical protein L7F78_06670 [Syntrophales bacterium LBB04]|nr:hypothetical protein [Syntrophales bacterium LBB04]